MKIVIDNAIPFIRGVFEPYADVVYEQADLIGPETVRDADALIVRTRTKIDAALLEGSSVKIVATATIGTDHIDLPWCDEHGILVRNAAGCNAGGVAQYVFSGLYGAASRNAISLDGFTIGIVGVGNVGRRVQTMATSLGFKVLKNDPPREEVEGPFEFTPLDELLKKSDVVTMHVPLNETTRHMADREFFKKMKKGAFFINAARGEIVDEQALKEAIPRLGPVILDTWEHEPQIDRELMDMVAIATPHIAGYSYQGKQNGTAAAVRAIAHYFGIDPLKEFFPPTEHPEDEAVKLEVRGKKQGEITSLFQYNYPIFTDDFMFRLSPDSFEKLRAEYRYRREIYFD